jgi:hypothetical protein
VICILPCGTNVRLVQRNSSPSIAKCTNVWSYTTDFPICFHGICSFLVLQIHILVIRAGIIKIQSCEKPCQSSAADKLS